MQKEAVVDREFRHEEPHTRDELKTKNKKEKYEERNSISRSNWHKEN